MDDDDMKEVLKLALEALINYEMLGVPEIEEAIAAAKKALAQPAQKPVAWAGVDFDINTTPPQRPWVGLTAEEILDLFDATNVYGSKWIEFARDVEIKLKERNHG